MTATSQTPALMALAVPVVLQRRRLPDVWTTARYRSTQMLRWRTSELLLRMDVRACQDHPPGQEQDAAVHVHEVAEGVDVGARHAAAAAEVQSDASRQGQRHQQVGHCQVHGVHHGGGAGTGDPAKDVESQAVEDHPNQQHQTVEDLQQRRAEMIQIHLNPDSPESKII